MPKTEAVSEPSTVHLILQGKGGVGKSYVAALLAQYLRTKPGPVTCLDVDPVNATFSQYASLGAQHVEVMRNGAIFERRFDDLVERLCTEPGSFVIDSGATTFVPLWNYICRNDVLALLRASGRRVLIHSVVAGGQALTDTIQGFESVAQTVTDRSIVVWVNEFFGEVSAEGKTFDQFKAAQANADKLLGVVFLPERNPQTFGEDIRQMLTERFLFEQARKSPKFSLVAKQRLTIVQRDLFQQLDTLPLT